jgi:hypothetical protein
MGSSAASWSNAAVPPPINVTWRRSVVRQQTVGDAVPKRRDDDHRRDARDTALVVSGETARVQRAWAGATSRE